MNRRAPLCARLLCFLLATLLSGIFPAGQAQTSTTLVATGSNLPEPLYVAWGDAYHAQHPETQVRYLPEGTGESARMILSGVGDLGGGDAPIPENGVKSAALPVLELPTVLIGIAVVYNLPNTPGELRLSGPVLADIFLGKAKSWNDPAIAKLNPALSPDWMQFSWQALREGHFVIGDDLSGAQLGRMEPERWSTMYKQLLDLKVIDNPFDPATAYTLQFVETK